MDSESLKVADCVLPGIHVLFSFDDVNPISQREKQSFINTLEKMKHFSWFTMDMIYDDSKIIIGRSYYDGYPFTIFQSKKDITILEGLIYNKSRARIEEELAGILPGFSTIEDLKATTREFLNDSDGEFLVIKYNKATGDCLIFNDALGRLPFYYSSCTDTNARRILLSREIKFAIPFLSDISFDDVSIVEYLLFGYCLDQKTLLKTVARLPSGSMLLLSAHDTRVVLKEVIRWNLDRKTTIDSLQEEAARMADTFVRSLRGISRSFSDEYSSIVSLSGGLDSRATLAGLRRANADAIAYSYPSGESEVAALTAQRLNVDHQVVSSSFKTTNEEYVKLFDGLLDIGLIPRISYLYGIRENTKGKSILYTGDGGDKTVGFLGLEHNVLNVRELAAYIVETDHIFDPKEIASIMNIPEDAVLEHLEKTLSAYPEKTMEGKFVHFKVFERGFKWLFVGEDRNRFFLWSTTPFYSKPFFDISMRIPQQHKRHYILYKIFLSALFPVLCQIRYYNRLVPLSIPDFLLKSYLTAFDWLKRHFYAWANINPIDFLAGKSLKENKLTLNTNKRLVRRFLTQRNTPIVREPTRMLKLVEKERNPIRLNVLTTLLLYANLLRSSRLLKSETTTNK